MFDFEAVGCLWSPFFGGGFEAGVWSSVLALWGFGRFVGAGLDISNVLGFRALNAKP